MCTTRSLTISHSICHACPNPAMHAPCHACPLPRMPHHACPPLHMSSCHACLLPCMTPAMHAPLPCTPPTMDAPLLPCMPPPSMQHPCHAHPAPHHTCPPCMPPATHATPLWTDRHLWKHNLLKLRLRAVITFPQLLLRTVKTESIVTMGITAPSAGFHKNKGGRHEDEGTSL